MRRVTAFLLCALAAVSSGGGAFSQGRPATIPAKDRMVVVISLDGFPAWTLDDPLLPTPTLRRLAREGAAAQRMKISNPAVTWPNHTSMVTGVQPDKHKVLYNGLLVRGGPKEPPKIEPWRDKSEMVHAPTVYDLAYKAGLTTAQVDWVAIQNPGTITWEFGERPDPQGVIVKEMIADGLLSEKEAREFNKNNPTWRDQVWTSAAVHILTKHRPNLLLFHLLNLDATHHRYGPKTPAGYTAQAYIDTRVQSLIDALQKANLLERTTILVVSDHGFKTAKRAIRANVALRQGGLLQGDGANLGGDAFVIPEGGVAMAYVTDPKNKGGLVPKMKEMFTAIEGVDRVLEPADYPRFGLPTPAESDQAPDLILVAKDGYSFSGGAVGDPVVALAEGASPGNHGYLSDDPEMDAIFIAWGYGVRGGERLGVIHNVDIAPTIAALLGLKMEGVAGRRLDPALKLPETARN